MPRRSIPTPDPDARISLAPTELGLFAIAARTIEARWGKLTVYQQARALALLSELSAATRPVREAPAQTG